MYVKRLFWVPSPLAGEGQGERKRSGNTLPHLNENCCRSIIETPP
jgi:hypothetical protein